MSNPYIFGAVLGIVLAVVLFPVLYVMARRRWPEESNDGFNYQAVIVTAECAHLGGPSIFLEQAKGEEPVEFPVPEKPAITVSMYNLETDETTQVTYDFDGSDTDKAVDILEAAGWRVTGPAEILVEGFYVASLLRASATAEKASK